MIIEKKQKLWQKIARKTPRLKLWRRFGNMYSTGLDIYCDFCGYKALTGYGEINNKQYCYPCYEIKKR